MNAKWLNLLKDDSNAVVFHSARAFFFQLFIRTI